MPPKKKSIIVFLKAQSAALIGTGIDFGVLYLLTEFVGLWYVFSNVLAAISGSIANFMLGRHWAFSAQDSELFKQAIKYSIVSFGSLLLNTAGLYVLISFLELHYMTSKVFVSIFIAVFYNFTLQKLFVFK